MKALLIFSTIILSLLNISRALAEQDQFLPVEQAFPYTVQLKGEEAHINWDISPGYYLYKSRINIKADGQALPLTFNKDGIKKQDEYFGDVEIYKTSLSIIATGVKTPQSLELSFQGCAEAGLCYPPVKIDISPDTNSNTLVTVPSQTELNTDDVSSISAFLQSGGFVFQMLIFFALGLGLAFTPCVFPMVPILSSIIVGQGDISTRKAFLMSTTYVLAMAMTYASAGVVVGYFGAQANVQLYLQNPWVLSIFSLVFVALAFSMFGFYQLQLPRVIQDRLSKAQQNQKSGQFMGVAIMGALSALVVSPCVSAPLAGILVYISTTADAVLGGAALLALGLGMGLPLIIIGTGAGKFLPKAGTWMDGVKNVFGVSLLAVAIWLLERVIPASFTMLLWALLLLGSGVYLGAFEQSTLGWKRLNKALGLSFSIYAVFLLIAMAAGHNNPLKPLGFLNNGSNSVSISTHTRQHKTITTSQELATALHAAQQQNQLLILDFYADWCISCKIMEQEIFSQQNVQTAMANTVFIQLDMTDNTQDQLALLKRFNLFGPPAVLFFKNKQEIHGARISSDVDQQGFLAKLKDAQS